MVEVPQGNGEVWANGTKRRYSAVVKGVAGGKDNGEFNYHHPATHTTIKAKVIKILYNCDCEMKVKVRTKHNCDYYVFLDDNGPGGSNDLFGLDFKATNPSWCPRETTSGPKPIDSRGADHNSVPRRSSRLFASRTTTSRRSIPGGSSTASIPIGRPVTVTGAASGGIVSSEKFDTSVKVMKKLVGAKPYEEFKAAIDSLLQTAQ